MEMLSTEYGWLPSQIEKESNQTINAYIDIISIKRKIEKNKLNKR